MVVGIGGGGELVGSLSRDGGTPISVKSPRVENSAKRGKCATAVFENFSSFRVRMFGDLSTATMTIRIAG